MSFILGFVAGAVTAVLVPAVYNFVKAKVGQVQSKL